MSKTTKIVLVAFAFSVFCLVLLSFWASRSVQESEASVQLQAPQPLPSRAVSADAASDQPVPVSTPMYAPRLESPRPNARPRPRGRIQPTPTPTPEVDLFQSARKSPHEEEMRKRVIDEYIAQLGKRAEMEKRISGVAPPKVGDVIDQILAEMDFGNIAFNSPERMKLNSPSDIQLVVSPTETIEKLKESIVAEGKKHGEQIRISDTMEARLTGTAFQIGAITPELQAVTGKEVTSWKWEVRPNQFGRHKLHLTLSAVVTLQGSSVPRTIRTFERTIEVEVSGFQRTFLIFRENWEWAWTIFTFPIIGWWLRRRHLKNNGTELVPPKTELAEQQPATPESEPSPPTESVTAPVASPVSEPEIAAASRTQELETETGKLDCAS